MVWVAFVGLAIVVLTLLGGYYLTEVALRPRVERSDAPYYARFAEDYPALQGWLDTLCSADALREVTLTADDGTSLHAYLLAAAEPTDRTAVVVHGYTDHPLGMLQYAWLYHHELGCNVLLPALRFHGKSGGRAIQMGWGDRLDVKRWIEALPALFGGEQRVVLHGLSMGAATVMMLSSDEERPVSVRCIVEDCGYLGVWEQFRKELKEDYHLPAFPILNAANLICRLRFGWSFKGASSLDAVRRSTCPMLFIHGGNDHYVPTWMVHLLYEAKGGQPHDKALWLAPDSGHADSFLDHSEAYTATVTDFVTRYL